MLAHRFVDSPLGRLRLIADAEALRALYFPEHRHARALEAAEAPGHPILDQAQRQLAEYFRGERRQFTVPLAPAGSPFQQRVWAALRDIPYGAQQSYAELAARIGQAAAVRAVGNANGKNPISIFIPCHRVIGKRGALTGYAGGLEIKQRLLAHEALS